MTVKYMQMNDLYNNNFLKRNLLKLIDFLKRNLLKLAVLLYKIVNILTLQRRQLYCYIIERKTAEKQ